MDLSKAPLRSPKAGGALLFPRKLQKITFLQYLDGTEEPEDPPLIELPPEEPAPEKDPGKTGGGTGSENGGKTGGGTDAPSGKETKADSRKEGKTERKKENADKEKPEKPKEPIRPVPSPEEENWGISQMDLF